MTNLEWLKAQINSIDDPKEVCDLVADYLQKHQWCVGSGESYGSDACSVKGCAVHWLKENHDIPPLKSGRIVEINDNLFVFTNRTFVGQNGGYELDSEFLRNCITKVYDAKSFDNCNKTTLIWRKS